MKPIKYQAFCLVCCGGGKLLGQPSGKRTAEITATGHMNAYGHTVTLISPRP